MWVGERHEEFSVVRGQIQSMLGEAAVEDLESRRAWGWYQRVRQEGLEPGCFPPGQNEGLRVFSLVLM